MSALGSGGFNSERVFVLAGAIFSSDTVETIAGALTAEAACSIVTVCRIDEMRDSWIAECPSIPGCIRQGGTRDEAAANLHEAILGCLEVRAEQGMPLTAETRLVKVAVA